MEMSEQQNSSVASSTQLAGLEESRGNLADCLNGLNQNGEAGLQKALDRIYPPTGHPVEDGPLTAEDLAEIDRRYPTRIPLEPDTYPANALSPRKTA